MFKNPLKYQQGGTTPSQKEQQVLVAFIQWLPKRVKEFQGMRPEAIAQALDGMSKTAEGKKQLQQLMMQFQQEMENESQAFKQGGKIHDFICKHARGGRVDCGCKSVEKAEDGTLLGRLYKRFIGQRMPDTIEATNRRVRTWTDSNGNQHIVEDANVNGNSTITNIDINGADTTGFQKVTTGDGRYRMINLEQGTPEWRTVMSRNVPQQENGGTVEMGKDGMSKLEALKKAKETHGYNNSQARFAYANAKNVLRNQGLRGRELRQSAREMISRGTREPIVAIDPTSPIQGVAVATLPNGSPLPAQTIVGSREPRMGNNYDNLTFSNAFLAARNKAGGDNGSFNWRGGKYTTALGNANNTANNTANNVYNMPELEPVVIENTEVEIPEYAPLSTNQVNTTLSELMYPGLNSMVNSNTPALESSWPVSTWISNQNNFRNIFDPYKLRDRQSRVLMVGSPALYNPSPMAFKNGGKVEKAQKGDVILQPGEETVWDIKKDTLRNGTLESHKWAKNNSTLPMSESEVRQWPGTYSRFIDGRDTILVRQTPMFKFYRSSLDPLHEIVTHSDGTPAGTNTYKTRASWNKENQYHDKLK